MSIILSVLAGLIGWFFLGYVAILLVNYLHCKDLCGFRVINAPIGEKDYNPVFALGPLSLLAVVTMFAGLLIVKTIMGVVSGIKKAWVYLKKYALSRTEIREEGGLRKS